eukprot:5501943-Pleurochrysis_carterae.AAC.1
MRIPEYANPGICESRNMPKAAQRVMSGAKTLGRAERAIAFASRAQSRNNAMRARRRNGRGCAYRQRVGSNQS